MRKFRKAFIILSLMISTFHIRSFADEVLIGIGDGPVEEILASSEEELRAMQDGSQLPSYIVEDANSEKKENVIEIADNMSDFSTFKNIISSGSATQTATPAINASSIVSSVIDNSSTVINAPMANPFFSTAQNIIKNRSDSGNTYRVPTVATTSLRSQLIKYAAQFLGNPYVYGGESLTEGADCSGYVQEIFKNFGIHTGRTSRDQYENALKIQETELQPGDLVFYASGDYINHVAIYAGEGIILHAANQSTGICTGRYDYRTPYAFGRFLMNG